MPGGDRTGPMGMGPMTGWGRGRCGVSAVRGGEHGFAGGWGRGGGGAGRGWRHRYWATEAPRGWVEPAQADPGFRAAADDQDLERRCEHLESELEAITRRLDELGAGEDK